MKSRITFNHKTGNLTIPDDILNEMTDCVMCQKPAVWKRNERGWMIQACEEHFEDVSKREIELIDGAIKKIDKIDRAMEKMFKNL